MDSAFYGRGAVHAALSGGASVSVTVWMDKRVKAAIATIAEDAWTAIEYTDAVFEEATGRRVSRAEVAEIDFVAFAAQKKAEQPYQRRTAAGEIDRTEVLPNLGRI